MQSNDDTNMIDPAGRWIEEVGAGLRAMGQRTENPEGVETSVYAFDELIRLAIERTTTPTGHLHKRVT